MSNNVGVTKLKSLFINHTNHSSAQWSPKQKAAAEKYGEILDFSFPDIGADWNEEKILLSVKENARKIIDMNPAAVLCQGEYNYTYLMINYLKQNNIVVLAATSERIVNEIIKADGSTQKISSFQFVKFRQY